ncbi:MAG: enoyl-CoA hydratase-related protein [Pseudomonadota bacterium]|nr:enoyl-CoA hydratase-related protein [Pseudomonadota bacterium]
MNMTFKTLQCEMLGAHILKIEMNRIEVSNAFNTEMAEDLVRCFETLAMNIHSPEQDIRVVILTGAGTKAFCAGGDLKERNGMSDDAWFSQHLVYERMVRAIMGCPIVIIGAINGAAYGGGCELVSMVDFAYAVPHARFAQTEVKLGIIPGAGGTQNLARAVGSRRAKELILTGAVFSADEAHEWGLINGVVPADQLLSVVTQKAEAIAANGPVAVRQAKMAIARAEDLSIADGLVFEIEAYNRCISTQDRREGIAAFNEKRPPKFTGT